MPILEKHIRKSTYIGIDFQKICYYSEPKKKNLKSLDEVDPELLKTYDKLGIPLEVRYSYFKIYRDELSELQAYNELVGIDDDYLFLHDDPSRGYFIDQSKIKERNLPIIKNSIKYSIFDFILILEKAKEILDLNVQHLSKNQSEYFEVLDTLEL